MRVGACASLCSGCSSSPFTPRSGMPTPGTEWRDWLMQWELRRKEETAQFRSMLETLTTEQGNTRALVGELREALGCAAETAPLANCLARESSTTFGSNPVSTVIGASSMLVRAPTATPISPKLGLTSDLPAGIDEAETVEEDQGDVSNQNAQMQDLAQQLRLAVGWKPQGGRTSVRAAKFSEEVGKCRQVLLALISSDRFQFFISAMIVLNSLCIGIQMHVDMKLALQHKPPHPSDRIINIVFASIFSVEMILRVTAEQLNFFRGDQRWWNAFDVFVVVASLVEVFLEGSGLSFLRVLRVLRSIRMMRIIRMFRFFRELRLMAMSLVSCAASLMWAALLMVLCMFLFGIILLDGARDHVRGLTASDEHFKAFEEHYGGVPNVLFTLILSISGGMDWYDLLTPYLTISKLYAIPFTMFVLFVMFGMLNILVGIFVQRSTELWHLDQELVMEEEMERNNSYLNQIQALFKKVDLDDSNTITWDELNSNLKDEKVMTYFALLHIDVSEAQGLFQLLDVNESGEVGIDEFIMGCMRLKGTAKSIDMATMMYENKRMAMKFNTFFSSTEQRLVDLQKALRALVPRGSPYFAALQGTVSHA